MFLQSNWLYQPGGADPSGADPDPTLEKDPVKDPDQLHGSG